MCLVVCVHEVGENEGVLVVVELLDVERVAVEFQNSSFVVIDVAVVRR